MIMNKSLRNREAIVTSNKEVAIAEKSSRVMAKDVPRDQVCDEKKRLKVLEALIKQAQDLDMGY